MAITFLEKRKRLKSLIPVFAIIIFITGIVIWRGFFVKGKPTFGEGALEPTAKPEINLQALESPDLESLLLFEKTPPFEGEAGRENPFAPY